MSDNTIELPEGLDVDAARDVLREFGQADDAQIINQSKLDSLESEIDEFKSVFAELLSEESPQSAETLSEQSAKALTEPYRDDEGSIEVDTLRQEPESGEVDTTEGTEGSDSTDISVDNLSLDDKEKIQTVLMPKRTSFKSRGMDSRVDALETQIADTFGAESYEEVEPELEAL